MLSLWALATTALAQAALFEAVAVGTYDEIEAALLAGGGTETNLGDAPVDEASVVPDGPLHVAAWSRDPTIVELLMHYGFNVNVRGDVGRTPLMLAAAFNRDPLVVVALVAAGADLEARDAEGYTALLLALRWSDRPAVVAQLIEAGADLAAVADDGADARALVLANPALDPIELGITGAPQD